MLCTLLSGAFRHSEGQLRITWFPRCAPESNSVRCAICSTGGKGGRRLPHAAKSKAKGKRKRTKARKERRFTFTTFAFLLLPFSFVIECTGSDPGPSPSQPASFHPTRHLPLRPLAQGP